MGRNHDRRRITVPPINRIGSAPSFERDDMIRQAFKAQDKLEFIKNIVNEFLNGESTPTNLVREVIQAVDVIHKVKEIAEQ